MKVFFYLRHMRRVQLHYPTLHLRVLRIFSPSLGGKASFWPSRTFPKAVPWKHLPTFFLLILMGLLSLPQPLQAQVPPRWHIPAIPGIGPNTASILSGGCLSITSSGPQRGVAWDSTQLDLTQPFDISLSVNQGPWGADGLAIVLQNVGLNAWGAGGNAIGFGNAIPPDPSYTAITPSIAFELDTWDNSPAGVADIGTDHLAIHRDGNMAIATAGPVSALPSGFDITDNICRWFRVTWTPGTNTLRMYYDNVLRLTTNINLINTVFGGNPLVWWGITGSSGGAPMAQTVCVGRQFARIIPDTALCFGNTLQLQARGGGTYLWSQGPPLLSNPNIANPVFTPTAAIPYNLDILVTNVAGCQDRDTILVTVEPVPVATPGGPFTRCTGDSILLGAIASPGIAYQWSPVTDLDDPTSAQPWWNPTAPGGGSFQLIATDTAGLAACADTATTVVTAFPLPSTTTSAAPAAICSGQPSTLLTTPSGGTAPYHYTWAVGGTTNSIMVSSPATYQLTVFDANSCKISDSITIVGLPSPTVNLGPDDSVCPGDSLLLHAGNVGATFLWNTGQTTDSVWQANPGSYWVQVTDGNGCSASDTILLGLFTPPVVNLGNDTTLCFGDSLLLDAGNPGSLYIWSTGGFTQAIVANVADTFTVIVRDTNTCITRDTIALAYSNTLTVALGNDTVACLGSTQLLDAGNPGSTFVWSTGDSTQQIAIAQTGTYNVQVTSAQGCQGADTILFTFLPSPTVNLGSDTTICAGTQLTLNAGNPGSLFLWNSGAATQTLTVNSAGVYAVRVTAASGCLGADSIVLQISPAPIPSLGPDQSICLGDSATLDVGNTPHNIVWSNGSTTQTQTFNTAGTFWVSLIDSLGCSGFDTCLIALFPLPIVTVVGLAPAYCITDSATQLVAQPIGGLFSGAANVSGLFAPAAVGIGPQTVSYAYTDSLGCTATDNQQTIVVGLPTPANAGPDLNAQGTAALQANVPAIGNGQWTLLSGSGAFSNIFDPQATFTPDADGQFPIVWTIENAPCPASLDTVWVTFEGLSIPNGFSPNNDGFNDRFVIRGIEGYPGSRLMIFNRWGNQVWKSENYQNDWEGHNDAQQPLTDDTYYYVLEYGNKKASNFVVLKR
jgi:gliding motility-associated-like protein